MRNIRLRKLDFLDVATPLRRRKHFKQIVYEGQGAKTLLFTNIGHKMLAIGGLGDNHGLEIIPAVLKKCLGCLLRLEARKLRKFRAGADSG